MPPQVKMGNVAGNFLQGMAQARKMRSQQQRRQALNELARERAQEIRQQRQKQQALAGLSQQYLNQPSQFGLGAGGQQGGGLQGVAAEQTAPAGGSLQALAAVDPRRAARLQKIKQQQIANQAQQEVQLLRQVNDQESYARAKRQAEQAGIVQPGQLPDQYPGDEWRDRNLQEDMEVLRQAGVIEQPDRSAAYQKYQELRGLMPGAPREQRLEAAGYDVGEEEGVELKPSHENAIRHMAVDFLGGVVDPRTGQIRGLDATKQRELLRLESQASQIYKKGDAPTLSRALEMAANRMGIQTRETQDTQKSQTPQEGGEGGGLREKVVGAYETVRDYFAGEEGEKQGEEENKARAEPQSRGDEVVLTDHPRFGDVTEDQIQFTMERHNISRKELIRRLKEQGAKDPQRNRQVTPSAP